jgi:transposase
MDERFKFVARLLEGEKMAVLCREFDISRKTGHKIFNRYKQSGLEVQQAGAYADPRETSQSRTLQYPPRC